MLFWAALSSICHAYPLVRGGRVTFFCGFCVPVFKRCSQNCQKRQVASSCFCPFVRLACPSAWNNSSPSEETSMEFEYFSKICRENSGFINISQESAYFTWRPLYVYDNIFLNCSKNDEFSDLNCTVYLNTHFI
jgi:hypothetical protein